MAHVRLLELFYQTLEVHLKRARLSDILKQQIISTLLSSESTVKNHLLQKVFTYMHDIEFPNDLKNVSVVRLVCVKVKLG